MEKSERIVRYTADQLDEMLRRGESQTDWARVDAMTEEELEASIDVEEEGEFDLSNGWPGIPGPKQEVTICLDADIIEWFKAQGGDYQRRMNDVLRDHVAARMRQQVLAAAGRARG